MQMSYHQQTNMPESAYTTGPSPAMYSQVTAQGRSSRDAHSQTTAYPQTLVNGSHNENAMNGMIAQFGGLGVHGTNVSSTGGLTANGAQLTAANGLYCTPDGQFLYATSGMYQQQPQATGQLPENAYGSYHTAALQYIPQPIYQGYQGYQVMPYTPSRAAYYGSDPTIGTKEVPALENRRGSYSTTESAPGTPYYGAVGYRDNGTQIAAMNGSPIYSTPSPQQLPHTMVNPQNVKTIQYAKGPLPHDIDMDALNMQHPAIPQAVPAVFTPRENMRTLEQSLSNPIYGNRNVYIRGLHPNTNDETLAQYAARFGPVETSKAIIDTTTGACKGFGFAKYWDVRHSELCIKGFYRLGYEVGFARESFNSRLKAEADESSTNLYVSNLPKSMTESELSAIFMDYTVNSSRILRDTQGNSRGVGFSRFESRDVCEEIIKKFHGQPIGEEGLLLQVRYADTPAQKDLKRVTTERRQFRTNEYNVGAYGGVGELHRASPPMSLPSPVYPRLGQIARHLPPQVKISGAWKPMTAMPAINNLPLPSFKDVNQQTPKVKATNTPIKQEVQHATATTPTVSEDGSADEGATIHSTSPIVRRADISPSAHKKA